MRYLSVTVAHLRYDIGPILASVRVTIIAYCVTKHSEPIELHFKF